MYRRFALLGLLAACSGDPDPAAPGEDPGRMYLVQGLLEDSVLNLPIGGVRVLIGDSVALSDSLGRFSTRHRGGRFTLEVTDRRFEGFATSLHILNDQFHRVRLRGEAPYLVSCLYDPSHLTGRVVDLQGRKTLNRRSQSTVTLVANESGRLLDAYAWSWTPVDNLTWLAHVPLGVTGADSAFWHLEDADGNVRSGWCTNRPAPCSNC